MIISANKHCAAATWPTLHDERLAACRFACTYPVLCLQCMNISRIAVRLNCILCAWQELQSYLRKGIQLDELWRVARGEIQYKDFSSSQTGNGATAAPPSIPEELVRSSGCLTIAIIACQTEAG